MTVIIHKPPPSKLIVEDKTTVVNVSNTPPKHFHNISDVYGLEDALDEVLGSFTSLTADTALGGHRVVVPTPTGCAYADNTNNSHLLKVIGVTIGAANLGATATIQLSGELGGLTGLTQGSPVWLSTNGNLTQTLPTSGFIQQIGIALSSTKININITPPIGI
jgi:hypothetical protein